MSRKTVLMSLPACALPALAQQSANDVALGDKSGPFLTVEPDGPTLKQFGKPALAGRFKRCP